MTIIFCRSCAKQIHESVPQFPPCDTTQSAADSAADAQTHAMANTVCGTHAPPHSPRTSSEQAFFDCTPDFKLFSVRKGAPSPSALASASCFLAAAIDIANQNDPNSDALWGSVYLIEMAKAIVDSVGANLESAKAVLNEKNPRQFDGPLT